MSVGGGSEVGQRGGELRCRVERLAEIEAVVEDLGIERGGALQVRDGLRRIVGEPERDAQVILRGRELGIEREGALEMAEGFVAAVEDGEQEADLVLDAGGFGIERGGLLPGGQCAGGVAARAGGGGLGFQVAELRLLGREQRSCRQQEKKGQAGRPAPRLELDAQAELPLSHLSKICDGEDLAGSGRIHLRVRLAEVHVVEGVEQLRAELALDALGELELLAQRGVGVEEVRPEEGVAGHVAEACRRPGGSRDRACSRWR